MKLPERSRKQSGAAPSSQDGPDPFENYYWNRGPRVEEEPEWSQVLYLRAHGHLSEDEAEVMLKRYLSLTTHLPSDAALSILQENGYDVRAALNVCNGMELPTPLSLLEEKVLLAAAPFKESVNRFGAIPRSESEVYDLLSHVDKAEVRNFFSKFGRDSFSLPKNMKDRVGNVAEQAIHYLVEELCIGIEDDSPLYTRPEKRITRSNKEAANGSPTQRFTGGNKNLVIDMVDYKRGRTNPALDEEDQDDFTPSGSRRNSFLGGHGSPMVNGVDPSAGRAHASPSVNSSRMSSTTNTEKKPRGRPRNGLTPSSSITPKRRQVPLSREVTPTLREGVKKQRPSLKNLAIAMVGWSDEAEEAGPTRYRRSGKEMEVDVSPLSGHNSTIPSPSMISSSSPVSRSDSGRSALHNKLAIAMNGWEAGVDVSSPRRLREKSSTPARYSPSMDSRESTPSRSIRSIFDGQSVITDVDGFKIPSLPRKSRSGPSSSPGSSISSRHSPPASH